MTLKNCQQTNALFIEKLDFLIHNLSKGEYYQFPELISVKDDITTATYKGMLIISIMLERI